LGTGQAQPEPPWTLSASRIREIVGRARVGRDLSPAAWPGGARVAVGLSFDLDNETGSLRDRRHSPSLLSQGEYGSRAGLPRVLALLDRHQVPASFFILTMHPHVIGHRGRAAMLDRLVGYMKSRPGVWFATHEQIARYVRDGRS
jgi:hypothetical protein